ncbi:MAG: hypothetical protein LBG59_09895 [Candidatus Peribacteria bacterium]|nr:hypothetical protein [Candidatus Peribacteria bacterium]
MIKLIIGNYLIAGTCFAFGECLTLRISQLQSSPTVKLWGVTYENFSHFLENGQLTFILLLFALLVFVVYRYSTITTTTLDNPQMEKISYLLYIPLTLFSFIFAFSLALIGEHLPTTMIKESVSNTFPFVAQFLNHLPLRMFAHGVLVILLISRIEISFTATKKTTTLPEGLDEL